MRPRSLYRRAKANEGADAMTPLRILNVIWTIE
jgi:hypothetical protein